jgi:hypothetical protein
LRSAELEECGHQVAACLQDAWVGISDGLEELQQPHPDLVALVAGLGPDQPEQSFEGGLDLTADHLRVGGVKLHADTVVGTGGREDDLRVITAGAGEQGCLGLADLCLDIAGIRR